MNRAHLFALVTLLSSAALAKEKEPLVLDAFLDPSQTVHSYTGNPGEAFADDVIPCSVDLASLQHASLSDFSSIAVRFSVAGGGALSLAHNTSLSAVMRTSTNGTCGSRAFTDDQRDDKSDLAIDGDDIVLESSFNDLTSTPQDGLDFEWRASGDSTWLLRSAVDARPSRAGAGNFDHMPCECSVDVLWVGYASDSVTPGDPGSLVTLVAAPAKPVVDPPHVVRAQPFATRAQEIPAAALVVDESVGCSSSGASVPVFGLALLLLLARRRLPGK